MTTYALRGHGHAAGATHAPAQVHAAWLAGGLVLAFLVPFLFADVLELPRDLYYGIYSGFAFALFAVWAGRTGQSVAEMVRRRWIAAVALGVLFAAVMASVVLGSEDATAGPVGLELAAAVAWRGVVYGLADGLLLSAFPILLVFAAFGRSPLRARVTGVIAIGLIALLASVAMTATYHLGYSDFRSEKVRKPIAGDLVWSVPTLATLNPIGAPIAHAGLHVTAVLHSYETDVYLPPHE